MYVGNHPSGGPRCAECGKSAIGSLTKDFNQIDSFAFLSEYSGSPYNFNLPVFCSQYCFDMAIGKTIKRYMPSPTIDETARDKLRENVRAYTRRQYEKLSRAASLVNYEYSQSEYDELIEDIDKENERRLKEIEKLPPESLASDEKIARQKAWEVFYADYHQQSTRILDQQKKEEAREKERLEKELQKQREWDEKHPPEIPAVTPEIPEQDWYSHCLLLAQTRFGKTNVIRWRLNQLLPQIAQGKASVVLMEPKGVLTEEVLHLSQVGAMRDLLVIIDPRDTRVSVNIFDKGDGTDHAIEETIGRVERVLNNVTSTLTAFQVDALTYSLRAMFCIDQPGSIRLLTRILKGGLKGLSVRGLPYVVEQYFNDFKAGDSSAMQVVNRLNGIVANPVSEALFDAERSTFNMLDAIQAGKLIVINASASNYIYARFWIEQVASCITPRFKIPFERRIPTTFIIDECFYEGTPVLTPSGYKPIESLRSGELVIGAYGVQSIIGTMSRIVDEIYEIELSDGTALRVTGNHPFFTAKGWVRARHLISTSALIHYCYVHDILHIYEMHHLSERLSEYEEQDLFSELWNEVSVEIQTRSDTRQYSTCGEKPKTQCGDFTSYDAKQSYAETSICSQNATHTQTNGTQYQDSWRQWRSNASPAKDTFSSTWNRMVRRTHSSDETQAQRVSPLLLQARYREPIEENFHRDRWCLTSSEDNETKRCKKDALSGIIRVESVTIQKRRSDDQSSGGYRVYNLHVATHPSYIVGNILAHNCQTWISEDLHFASILDKAAEARIGMLIAAHHMNQIKDLQVRGSIYTNTAMKFAARTTEDVNHLCGSMGLTEPDFIRTLPQYEFAYFGLGMDRAIKVKLPLVEFDKMPRMNEEEYQQMGAENRKRYNYDRNHIPESPILRKLELVDDVDDGAHTFMLIDLQPGKKLAIGGRVCLLTCDADHKAYAFDNNASTFKIPLAGIVRRVLISPGDKVRPGLTIAMIEDDQPSSKPVRTQNKSSCNSRAVMVKCQPDGHVYVKLSINAHIITLLVDTGASDVALTKKDAERVGFDLSALKFTGTGNTASGKTRRASIELKSVSIEKFEMRNVEASVLESLPLSLLGQSFLRRLTRYEIREGIFTMIWPDEPADHPQQEPDDYE